MPEKRAGMMLWDKFVRALLKKRQSKSCRVNLLLTLFAGLLVMVGQVVPAYADPYRAPLPSQAGMHVSGTVRYVGDGDGLCVGCSADPNKRIEVRLADNDASELSQSSGRAARTAPRRIALHLEIRCIAE